MKKIRGKGIVFQTQKPLFHRIKFHLPICSRRISSVFSRQRRGSMTVETALALPVFLLSSLMLLSAVDMMNTYICAEEKLYEQTRQAAVFAGKGASLTGSGGADFVEFYKPCVVKPAVKGPGYRSFLLMVHCRAHVWNGYGFAEDFSKAEHADYVFVTESGTVYHEKRSCSHLRITIQEVRKSQVGGERNEDGSRYRPCPYCTRGMTDTAVVYTTPYGNKYHASLTCSGLKRTVRAVRRDQAEGRRACSECGG